LKKDMAGRRFGEKRYGGKKDTAGVKNTEKQTGVSPAYWETLLVGTSMNFDRWRSLGGMARQCGGYLAGSRLLPIGVHEHDDGQTSAIKYHCTDGPPTMHDDDGRRHRIASTSYLQSSIHY
jgi:hypothetical protein